MSNIELEDECVKLLKIVNEQVERVGNNFDSKVFYFFY